MVSIPWLIISSPKENSFSKTTLSVEVSLWIEFEILSKNKKQKKMITILMFKGRKIFYIDIKGIWFNIIFIEKLTSLFVFG